MGEKKWKNKQTTKPNTEPDLHMDIASDQGFHLPYIFSLPIQTLVEPCSFCQCDDVEQAVCYVWWDEQKYLWK